MNFSINRAAVAGLLLSSAPQLRGHARLALHLSADAAMGYSTDPGGCLSFEYDYLHQNQLRDGTRSVSGVRTARSSSATP